MADRTYLELYGFTFDNEVQAGVSNRPHWPEGDSGLTLGPGYDIGERTAAEAEDFLRNTLGMTGPAVDVFAAGAGRKGAAAKQYLDAHRAELNGLVLNREQEETIFCILAPRYEQGVKRILATRHPTVSWDSLDRSQKCLLFDYHYNVGLTKFPKFMRAVLGKDWKTAREESRRGGLEGSRREAETYAMLDDLIAQTGTAIV